MSLKEEVLSRMAEMGVSPKRSLGQNFLINNQVIQKIIAKVEAYAPNGVVEVGPGLGALTEPILALVQKKNLSLQLIEMDREFSAYWKGRGLNVLEGDALQVDWNDLPLSEGAVFVSNLPYQISARIVIERSVSPQGISAMVLMFQREVAERILAKPRNKDYGFLSVVSQLAWKIERVVDARPADFTPAPRVSSRVLGFSRIRALPPQAIEFFKRAFENRRKYMLKNFVAEQEQLLPALSAMGFDHRVRAEELSPQQFQDLFEVWKKSSPASK